MYTDDNDNLRQVSPAELKELMPFLDLEKYTISREADGFGWRVNAPADQPGSMVKCDAVINDFVQNGLKRGTINIHDAADMTPDEVADFLEEITPTEKG